MKVFDIVLIITFVLFIVISLYVIAMLRSEGVNCYANPSEYAVKKYEQATNTSVSCVCSFYNPKFLPLLITSNGTSVYEPLVKQPENYTPITINWSSLKFG